MLKLFIHFLKFQLTNIAEILQGLFFFISSLFIFSFFLSKAAGATISIYSGFIFIIMLLTINLRATSLFAFEYKERVLDQLILHNYTSLQIIMARFFSFLLMEILPLILFLPLASLFFNFALEEVVFLGKVLLLALPLLSSIFILNAVLLLPVNNKVMLLSVVSMPLLIAPVIFVALTILSYFSPEIGDYKSYITTLVYLDFLIIPVAILLASKALDLLYRDKFQKG